MAMRQTRSRWRLDRSRMLIAALAGIALCALTPSTAGSRSVPSAAVLVERPVAAVKPVPFGTRAACCYLLDIVTHTQMQAIFQTEQDGVLGNYSVDWAWHAVQVVTVVGKGRNLKIRGASKARVSATFHEEGSAERPVSHCARWISTDPAPGTQRYLFATDTRPVANLVRTERRLYLAIAVGRPFAGTFGTCPELSGRHGKSASSTDMDGLSGPWSFPAVPLTPLRRVAPGVYFARGLDRDIGGRTHETFGIRHEMVGAGNGVSVTIAWLPPLKGIGIPDAAGALTKYKRSDGFKPREVG
jgi:hypothetical protein